MVNSLPLACCWCAHRRCSSRRGPGGHGGGACDRCLRRQWRGRQRCVLCGLRRAVVRRSHFAVGVVVAARGRTPLRRRAARAHRATAHSIFQSDAARLRPPAAVPTTDTLANWPARELYLTGRHQWSARAAAAARSHCALGNHVHVAGLDGRVRAEHERAVESNVAAAPTACGEAARGRPAPQPPHLAVRAAALDAEALAASAAVYVVVAPNVQLFTLIALVPDDRSAACSPTQRQWRASCVHPHKHRHAQTQLSPSANANTATYTAKPQYTPDAQT